MGRRARTFALPLKRGSGMSREASASQEPTSRRLLPRATPQGPQRQLASSAASMTASYGLHRQR